MATLPHAAAPVGGCDPSASTVTLRVFSWEFPERSVARTVTVCAPSFTVEGFHEKLQLLVPVASAYAPPSIRSSTLATLTLSLAVPVNAVRPVRTAPAAGALMVRLGGAASAYVTVSVGL